MKTFKQFLSEAVLKKWKTDPLSVKKAIKILNTNCKQGLMAIKNDGLLYRGFTSTKDLDSSRVNIIDTSNSARTSRDTNNMYQMGMDASENLLDFPSRTKSLICSSYLHTAKSYGNGIAYIIIPFDGVKVAHCKFESDIFESDMSIRGMKKGNIQDISSGLKNMLDMLDGRLPRIMSDIKAINSIMAKWSPEFLTIALCATFNRQMINPKGNIGGAPDSLKLLNSIQQFGSNSKKKDILSLEEYLKDNSTGTKDGDFYLNLFRNAPTDKRFTALATEWFTPKNLNLSLVDFGTRTPYNVECWVSGKAIVIEHDLFADILIELDKLKYPIHHNVRSIFDIENIKTPKNKKNKRPWDDE